MSITYRQFLGHLRKLAVAALSKYEIQDAKLKFINYSGNGLSLLEDGTVTLRVASGRYQDVPPESATSTEEVKLEP